MNYEKELVENVTPLLGNNNNSNQKMISDTGSDCPYTKMNDSNAENYESNLYDLHGDSQFVVEKVGDNDHFSLQVGPKIQPLENGATEARPYIGMKEDAPEYHRYNEYIKNGYRINYYTWKSTLWSLF